MYLLLSGYFLATAALPGVNEGLRELKTGQRQLLINPADAAPYFQAASLAFEKSAEGLKEAPFLSKLLTPLPPFRWQVRLLKASHALAQTGESVSVLAASFPSLQVEDKSDISALITRGSAEYFQWFEKEQAEITRLQEYLTEAEAQLYGLPAWIMFNQSAEIRQLQKQVSAARRGLQTSVQLTQATRRAFGSEDKNPHTFLILFQNNGELRPTGGFLGSFAIMNTSGGTIRQFQFGPNVYKLDKILIPKTNLQPPVQLQTIAPHWGFRDANVGFGFLEPASGQIISMYEQATGLRPEGLIFLDTTLLEDVLSITGPLSLPGSDEQITAANVRNILTQEIEKDYFLKDENRLTNEPKQILFDLLPPLLSRLQKTPRGLSQLVPKVAEAVERKSIQLWSSNSRLQELLQSSLPSDQPASGDWLKIVNTNLGGFKSSANMVQNMSLSQSRQSLQRLLLHKLEIERVHQGDGKWPDADNRNYLEIYLPAEAEIIQLPTSIGGEILIPEAEQKKIGIFGKKWKTEVTEEAGWKKVGLWATTKVGETTKYTLTYSLPLTSQFESEFVYLKQAGAGQESFEGFGYNGEVKGNLTLTK